MCRKPNIVTTVKVRIIEWAGHLLSMSDDSTVKKGKQGGRTKA
jgi:hypothetical protein